jgi:hypothetical protein
MSRASAIVSLILVVCAAPAAAQRPSYSYEIAVELPNIIDDTLRRLTRDGLTCAAVARPVGMRLSTRVAVIMDRPVGTSKTTAAALTSADVSVVTATAGTVGELGPRLDAAAAQGFSLCGITMTSHIWGQPSEFAIVAILTRTGTSPIATSYRVIRSRGRREDWKLLEQAAAEGFVVSHLVSRPQPGSTNTSDIVFLAEKSAASRPTRYELAFAGNGPALQKEIDKSTQRGHCVQAAWATPERMTVLLARPIDAACDRPHEYEIEESGRFDINGADGELLGLFRIKEGAMALYDGRNRSLEYRVIEGVLPDPRFRLFTPREHRLLTEMLDVDGKRGFRPVDVTWRETGSDLRAIDIIMSRPRQ